jgi:isoleucyl-tRNA synthetase
MLDSSFYNSQKIEEEILRFWKENKIFEKLRKKNEGKKRFSFLDGPITANNPMGVHHAWGRTLKDLFQRFWALRGYDQRYQNGFDCHGLWVEVEVEKELGFKTKKDIEKFGIENFVNECKKRVIKYSNIQTQQSIRLGQWMDWENSYYTMDDKNIEAIWFFLKKCFEKGWLYESYKVMPWCPRCGTSLSQHELLDSYKEIVHPGVYVKFKLKNKENEHLLIWTTTPWTLSSNVAAAVNPSLIYVKVKVNNEVLYLGKSAAQRILSNYEILEELEGDKLKDLEYVSLYPEFYGQDFPHKVILWKDVKEEEGTGIVHIAPGCGEEDYELGRENNLIAISPLDEYGIFKNGFLWLEGKTAKEANELIIEDLRKRNMLFKIENYLHRYPVCWRCKEELVFRLVNEWFIKMDELKPKLIKAAKNIKWKPSFGEDLMIDWLNNMKDWCISRKRYYGLPLPFYKCECGNLEVIGSREELEKKAICGIDQLKELHRPWIDKVKIRCSKCGKEVERIKDVGDCWLDAGIVALSTLKYFDDINYWKKWYPADFVCEMREQIKLWFYFVLLMSITITNRIPYKNAIFYEKILDEVGRPMHKSLGNAIWLDEAIEKVGADTLRWLYVTHDPKDNLRFGFRVLDEIKRKLNIFYNTHRYVKTYLTINNFFPKKIKKYNNLNLWLLSRLENVKNEVTNLLEDYDFFKASNILENFILEDFSRWYIHFIRDKVKEGYEGKDKEEILQTLYETQLTIIRLLSPFLPFMTEAMYQDFFRSFEDVESVHLFGWPKINKKFINNEIEEEMNIIREITESINSLKKERGIKLRWIIDKLIIQTDDEKVKKACKDFEEELKIISNAKAIEFSSIEKGKEFSKGKVEIGNILEEESFVKELIRIIQDTRKNKGLEVKDKIILYLDSKILEKFEEDIKKGVNAKEIIFGSFEDFFGSMRFKEVEIRFKFEKI